MCKQLNSNTKRVRWTVSTVGTLHGPLNPTTVERPETELWNFPYNTKDIKQHDISQ